MNPSLRPEYVAAAAAYILGYPLLRQVMANMGIFDELIPVYTVWELMGIPGPRGMNLEQAFAYATCVKSKGRCELVVAAYTFVPLAIVWSSVRGLIKDEGGPRIVRTETAFLLCLVVSFVLVTISDILMRDVMGSGGLMTYGEGWRFIPGMSAIKHVGYAIAAWCAAHHCVRVYGEERPPTLFDAVRSGDGEALAKLLESGADPNETDADGASPLHVAGERGESGAIAALARGGAKLDARDGDGATALHRAVTAGHGEAVVELLDLGADRTVLDDAGRSALDRWSGARTGAFKRLSAGSGPETDERQ